MLQAFLHKNHQKQSLVYFVDILKRLILSIKQDQHSQQVLVSHQDNQDCTRSIKNLTSSQCFSDDNKFQLLHLMMFYSKQTLCDTSD